MSQSTKVVNELYNKTSELGTSMSSMYLIGAIVIGVILAIYGIMNLRSQNSSMGWISLVIAIIIVGIIYFNYNSTNNKPLASYEVVESFVDAV